MLNYTWSYNINNKYYMNWLPRCEKVANNLRSIKYHFTLLRDLVSERGIKN